MSFKLSAIRDAKSLDTLRKNGTLGLAFALLDGQDDPNTLLNFVTGSEAATNMIGFTITEALEWGLIDALPRGKLHDIFGVIPLYK